MGDGDVWEMGMCGRWGIHTILVFYNVPAELERQLAEMKKAFSDAQAALVCLHVGAP